MDILLTFLGRYFTSALYLWCALAEYEPVAARYR